MKFKTSRSGFSFFDGLFRFLDNRQPSDRFIFSLLLLTFLISLWYTLYAINDSYVTEVPTAGGTLVEGVVGAPRFVNPVLAITRADHDLVALTYSGLMTLTPQGTLAPDLAESVTVSDDGLVYNVVLKQGQKFHDNSEITSEDVAFTIGLIQNAALKSPLRGNWSGVKVEVLGDYELNFVLDDAYAPFIENLTVGVMPKHIWSTLTDEELPFSQHNTEPIGSGPYRLSEIMHGQSGLINEYSLTAFEQNGVKPNIDKVVIRFYQNEAEVAEALKSKEINSTAALGENTLTTINLEDWAMVEKPLPRVFSVFFNQNKSPVLRDPYVREALETAIDRKELIKRALNGFGIETNNPLPPAFSSLFKGFSEEEKNTEDRLAEARDILTNDGWQETEDGGWTKEIDQATTTLALTLRSANAPVFENTSAYLIEVWQALGVEVGVELFEQNDLVQSVIRPRDYQALLFGLDIGRPLDLYPFWHSSQREDPGLNIAFYTSISSDRLLEKARVTNDLNERDQYLESFVDEIETEQPAIFLFSPAFNYLATNNIHTVDMKGLAKPSERFSNIEDWYMNQSNVWPVFIN